MERSRIFGALKNLKQFNEKRKASNIQPVFVTDHLPKEFQIQKKRLMQRFKEARAQNKSTCWRAEEGQYCLYIDYVKIPPTY